jgi:hypothetical protein
LKIGLASVAIVGIGAAITTAAWTDQVFFTATATASSFDLQGRTGTSGAWLDIGTDVTPITLTSVELGALSPGMDFDVPFQLCNAGTVAGTITAISPLALTGTLFTVAGAEITVTLTAPTVSTPVPSDPSCAAPITGTVHVTTTAAFPPAAMGSAGTITFDVTGTSS